MKLVVAVSGGIDSVVLLDMLVRPGRYALVVAHFDHGIREDSAADARFVEGLADFYGLPFETRREELGPNASEELARTRRYAFLQEVADKHDAWIATAHHMNDVAETIAINLTRGTGWRGLAVMASEHMRIERLLLGKTKRDLVAYALEHNLEWCEDSTNSSDKYLRNRLRRKITDETLVRQLMSLRDKQVELKDEIHDELMEVAMFSQPPYSRYFFSQIEVTAAMECLQIITSLQLTRPQIERLLLAIKTQKPGSQYEAGAGIKVHFTTRHFSLEMVN
ncbi:MAG TPA: tRNA lysidine(34) synthetase TilS [Candidatus Saccharibacteria bacterium]|nr:tRNA lysidine(34) synthetase TilS [Candidatus Saccharibacteria bacterium]